MQAWSLDSITVVELTCIRTLFIEYLSQTDSFNVLQEKASLIAIDAVSPRRIVNTFQTLIDNTVIVNIVTNKSVCVQLAWLKKEWQI